MFDTTQAGFYRSERTGRVVFMEHIRHFNDGTGRIHACFRGTRDGKPFGRVFSKPIEDFFETYEFIEGRSCEEGNNGRCTPCEQIGVHYCPKA